MSAPFCTECGSPLPQGAKFCPQCGTKVVGAPLQDAPAPGIIPDPLVPPDLRLKYERARKELRGDRREVVVLFADLSGFTALSEQLDPEEVSHLMHGLLGELAEVVYRYEGYVDKYIGDAIMALFGAPIAHENDADRAVLAALDMLEVTARRNAEGAHRLSLRVGLNLGEVVAAHVGSDARHQYTVMGDTVNVASRLESAAAPDSVLVSRAVYERISSRFVVEEVEPLTVKGKSEPLSAYRVLRFGSAVPARCVDSTPFVGREEELATLEGLFRNVAEGERRALVIEAEAGTGKSRLVREALSRTGVPLDVLEIDFTQITLPGHVSVTADLFHQLVSTPDPGPAVDSSLLLARACELLENDGERHRAGIAGLVRQLAGTVDESIEESSLEAADPSVARQSRWLALAALLIGKSRRGPILFLFEDVHWADETDQEFLAFLVNTIPKAPIGILLTVRSRTDLAWLPRDAARLRLENLGAEAVRSYLGGLFESLRPSVRKELIRRSEGNPLYLEELARSLRESVEAAALAVPGSVQGLLRSRIDRQAAPVRLLIQMASVLGTRFSLPLLSRMYQLESQPLEFDSAFGTLQQEGFVDSTTGGDTVSFRHALMQEVAYGSILGRVRKVLHESAARLGEEEYADRLDAEAPFFAHHYWHAGLLPEAAPHLWKAGQAAAQNFELHAAERYLGRLTKVAGEHPAILPDPEDQTALLLTYGTVLKDRGRFEMAEESFERLQKLGEGEGRADWTAKALYNRGIIAFFRGQLDEAQARFDEGLAYVSEDNDRTEADLHNGMGLVLYYRGQAEASLGQHRQALVLRRALDDRSGIVKSLINIGNVLFDLQDDLVGAQDHFLRALDMAREVGDRSSQCGLLLNLGTIELDYGNFESALERLTQVLEMADEQGLSFIRFLGLRNQAACNIRLGRIQQALQILRTCLHDGKDILEPVNRVAVRIFLYEAHLCAMDDDGAIDWLGESQELAKRLGVTEQQDWLQICEGRWSVAQGRWVDAVGAFDEASKTAERLGHPTYGRLARAHRWRAMARAGLEVADPDFLASDDRKSLNALVRYLWADGSAFLGNLREAASALAKAGDLAASIGDPTLERAVFQRLAEVLVELGEEPGAREAGLRAARAMSALRRGLPEELRVIFDAHPRNAGLRAVAHA